MCNFTQFTILSVKFASQFIMDIVAFEIHATCSHLF